MKRSLTFCVLGNSFITWVDRTATSARLPWWRGHTQTLKVPICVMSDALNCPHYWPKQNACQSSFFCRWWTMTPGIDPLSVQSAQFSRSVVSDSWRPHGLWHTRLPCPYQLLEFTQTHVHWVSDATQPSHPLSSPSPPAFNLSQHQGLFKWVGSLHQVAKALEFQLQHQSFQWIFRTDFL